MKQSIYKLLLVFMLCSLFIADLSIAQSNCKVLLDNIAGQYEGDCKKGIANGTGIAKGEDTYSGEFKKGLPHGPGTYTWANGDVFIGEFNKGQKDGKGKLTITLPDGQQKEQVGYWANDEYIGEYESPYKLHYRSPGVLSVRFKETENIANDGSALFFEMQQKGKIQSNAEFNINVTNGSFRSKFPVGNKVKVLVDNFPFGFTINYMGQTVEIEIYKNTSWNITIDYS